MAKLTAKEYFELDSLFIDLLNVESGLQSEDIIDISFYLLKALSEQNIVDRDEILDYEPDKPAPPKGDTTQLEFDPEIHL